MQYTYSTLGEKLENRLPGSKKLQYCANFVYEDGSLKYILNEEGKLNVGDGSNSYQFFVKDHLGNTRLSVKEDGTVEELNHYYPFGMRMGMANSKSDPDQKYLYNGKEMQDETDWLDYGARMYDASLGRTTTMDPHLESYYSASPFSFFANNPINFIDPTGKDIVFWIWEMDDEGGFNKSKSTYDQLDKKTQQAIQAFLKTDMGKGFMGMFANAGDKIGDVEFAEDGVYAKHTFNFETIDGPAGVEGTSMSPINHTGAIGPPEEGQNSLNNAEFTIRVQSANWLDNGQVNHPETFGHEVYLHLNQYLDKYVEALETGGAAAANGVYDNYLKGNYRGYKDHYAMANKTKRAQLYYKFINQLKGVLNPAQVEKHVQSERKKVRSAAQRQESESKRR